MIETDFCEILRLSAKNCVLLQIFAKNKTRYKQLCFTRVCVENWFLPKFKLLFLKKFILRKACSKNMTRSWKLRFTSVNLGNWLFLKFKPFLPKNAITVKSAQRRKLAPKNCLLLQWISEIGFCPNLSLSNRKNRFCVKSSPKTQLVPENCVLL